jgi:hypothetical protein
MILRIANKDSNSIEVKIMTPIRFDTLEHN